MRKSHAKMAGLYFDSAGVARCAPHFFMRACLLSFPCFLKAYNVRRHVVIKKQSCEDAKMRRREYLPELFLFPEKRATAMSMAICSIAIFH